MRAQDEAGVRAARGGADAHAAGLAALLLRFTRAHHTGAERAAGGVQAAGHHGRAGQKAAGSGRLRRHRAHHARARHNLRQKIGPHAQLAAERRVPAVFCHLIAGPAVALAFVLHGGARQPIDKIAVRLQDLPRVFIDLRPLAAVPDHLRHGVGGGKRVAAHGKEPLLPHRTVDFLTQRRGTRVIPDGRRAQRAAIAIDGDGAPALTVHADAGDAGGSDLPLLQHLPDRAADGFPPLLRVLLRPAGVRAGNAVCSGGLRHHAAFAVKSGCLARGGADVYAEQNVAHGTLTPFRRSRTRACGSSPAPSRGGGLRGRTPSGQTHSGFLAGPP